MLARILLWWGATVIALLYLAIIVGAAPDAYVRGGVGGLVVALVVLSALPSLVLGAILSR